MSEVTEAQDAVEEEVVAPEGLTRDQIRTAVFADQKPDTRVVRLFGTFVELHQPTLGAILDARDEGDERTRTADVFIRYAYVPGTNDRVFQDEDRDLILNWPFTEDLVRIQEIIAELTGVDLQAAIAEMKADPLGD